MNDVKMGLTPLEARQERDVAGSVIPDGVEVGLRRPLPWLPKWLFCAHVWTRGGVREGGWFRLFWVFGVNWVRVRERGMLFSERYGYGAFVVFNGWLFRWIRPGWRV